MAVPPELRLVSTLMASMGCAVLPPMISTSLPAIPFPVCREMVLMTCSTIISLEGIFAFPSETAGSTNSTPIPLSFSMFSCTIV